MQKLFETIAASPTLQAISILISCGSLLIFVFKLVWPATNFLKNTLKEGVKRAYVKSLRKILKRVRRDSRDQRLIVTTLFYYSTASMTGILFPIIMSLGIIMTEKSMASMGLYKMEPESLPLKENILTYLMTVPVSFALTWLTIYPTWRLLRYCRYMRRHLLRGLGMGQQ